MTAVDLLRGRLDQLASATELAYDEVVRLCQGGRWRMTVPVDQGRDSDELLTAALKGALALLSVVRGVADLADELRAEADRHDDAEPATRADLTRMIAASRAARHAADRLSALLTPLTEGNPT